MSAVFGAIIFDQALGLIIPRTVPQVEDIENPAGVDASLSLIVGQRSSVTYRGWFPASLRDDLFAMVDTVVPADDETGARHTVRVCRVLPHERKSLCNGALGRWIECQVEVKPWA